MRKLIVLFMVALSCFNTSVTAKQATLPYCDLTKNTGFLNSTQEMDGELVDIEADNAQLVGKGTSIFKGNVVVKRGGQELTTNRASYNQSSGIITAQNKLRLRDSDIILDADQAEWSLNSDRGVLIDAEYLLRRSHARGEAGYVSKNGASETDLHNASYTTCLKGDNFWSLKATEVHLDHQEAVGTAMDVVVRIKDVPVFYTPYITFPLNDERKSGLLVPSLGSSSETGLDVQTPFYWNIAPGSDATVTPRYMSERGLQINGEYRYKYQQGSGEVNLGFLESDELKKDGDDINPFYGMDRKHFSLKHNSRFKSGWSSDIDYNYVSDSAYLEDFGSNLSLASTTHLKRGLKVNYSGDIWTFKGKLQSYQTITNTMKPYQRLPQLMLKGSLPDQLLGLSYGLHAEFTEFDHADLVAGRRIHIEPSMSLPLQSAAAFMTPRMSLKHTRYDLNENTTGLSDDSPSRTLPIFSVDTGLFFERDMTISNTNYIHTLEPRAFYLYVPDRDQSDIPIFDSSMRTFHFGSLFAYNHFSGNDRVGDANRLSMALTSKIINSETGRVHFRASLGKIQHFQDRDVVMPSGKKGTRSDSDMVAEVSAAIARDWTARGELQWNPHGNISNLSSLQLRYRGNNEQLLNISHRYRRDGTSVLNGLEQVDISGRLPISNQWSVVGRYYRSIRDGSLLEGLAGVEYQSCCWATRLVIRDYVNDASDQDRNLALLFQVELKGLGNFGKKTDALLGRSILGYDQD
jgi:LPS-assembly protein